MTSAEPARQDEVHVVADVDGVTREAEAWFRVDQERRHLEMGIRGPDKYHGDLDVTGDRATASVTVFLHTERAGSGDIDRVSPAPRRSQTAGGSARCPVPPVERPAGSRQQNRGMAGGLSRRPSP